MPMTPGTYAPDDLPTLAREAHEASGLTQAAAAEQLGVSQPAYAQALSKRPGLDALRRRIVEAFTGYRVEGPNYVLVQKA
jgi:transcriptional regulator with XRE-family HTH domain